MSRELSPDTRPAVSRFLACAVLAGVLLAPVPGHAASPVISGAPATSVTVGTSYWFRPTASDADGDRLSFSIRNKPAWASFSRRSGRLSGTPTAAGTHSNIVISVTDGSSVANLPAFAINVVSTTPPPAPPPSISGSPQTTARVGQAWSFTPTASDPSGRTLTFSVSNKPAWTTFNTTTGTLAGTPGAVDVGTFANIVITANNGSSSSSLAPFSIAVQQISTGSVTIAWDPPTTRADGTPLANLSGYRVYYGTAAGSYPNRLVVNSPGLTSLVVENLPPGTYWFVVTAVDADGLESAQSAATSRTIG